MTDLELKLIALALTIALVGAFILLIFIIKLICDGIQKKRKK